MAHLKDLIVNGPARILGKIMSPIFEGSISMGREENTDIGVSSVALGSEVIASGDNSHAEGGKTTASNTYAHAEGYKTTASGAGSHAEGDNSVASGVASHAEGRSTASDNYAHAEGYKTTASGPHAHAEGIETIASGWAAHAEGSYTDASGSESHVEGSYTLAQGVSSHAEGAGTVARSRSQHAQGEYNIIPIATVDGREGTYYAHIVGNGTDDDNRSNAHTLDWNGNAWFAGDVYVGSTSGTNKDTGSKKLATTNEALLKTGGTMTGNIIMDNTATTVQKSEPYIQWQSVGGNNPYMGLAHDQTDGTFIICSMEKDTTTYGVKNYKNGLAIGGGSGNLFWKGNQIATTNNIPTGFSISATANDDDIVVLSGSGSTNSVSYTANHAKKGPLDNFAHGNTDNAFSIPNISVDTYGHTTAIANGQKFIIADTLPAASTSYNGTICIVY